MEKSVLVLLVFVAVVFGQAWVQRASVRHPTDFFLEVMQETVYELERRGWSSLKLEDIDQTIDLQMYSLLVNGTVLYTNGFLVSVQKLDVSGITSSVSSPTINGVVTPRASVSGNMIMREPKLGYDVVADLADIGVERTTGDITLTAITFTFTIAKNLLTGEITVTVGNGTSGGTAIRMVYKPPSHVTEVLSRNFFPYTPGPGIQDWRDIIQPIVLDIVTNKIHFPDICFTDC